MLLPYSSVRIQTAFSKEKINARGLGDTVITQAVRSQPAHGGDSAAARALDDLQLATGCTGELARNRKAPPAPSGSPSAEARAAQPKR